MSDTLGPKDAAEAIAIFRTQVIGPLVCRQLSRGELAAALRELSKTPVRTPSGAMRRYSRTTLERWLYGYRAGGVAALRPDDRRRGYATQLTDAQRQLLLAIRAEHRTASVPLILRTLEAHGRLEPGTRVQTAASSESRG